MQSDNAKIFSWPSKVRDYECDIGFFVHNATYLNYMEQARHDYLRALKFDFAEYAKKIGKPLPGLLNAAKRQTLSAFREKGVWKIGEDSV